MAPRESEIVCLHQILRGQLPGGPLGAPRACDCMTGVKMNAADYGVADSNPSARASDQPLAFIFSFLGGRGAEPCPSWSLVQGVQRTPLL
jgi:hypothetical protein